MIALVELAKSYMERMDNLESVRNCLKTTLQKSTVVDSYMERMDNLESVRNCLKTTLQKSTVVDSALNQSQIRLELLHQKWQSLESSQFSFFDVGDHIDSALCSAAAVLKVFDSVQQLESSLLTDPSSDLSTFLSNTRKLEEALKLLTDNCSLAVGWLHGILEFLQDKSITSEIYLLKVKKPLRILQQLQVLEEEARLDGGHLSAAFDKLVMEFQRILITNTVPLPLASFGSSIAQQTSISTLPFPSSVIGDLQAILDRLIGVDKLEECKAIYVQVRGTNAQRSLKALDLSYLEVLSTEFGDMHSIENYIDQWGVHLELVAKHLLEIEYVLCSDVFEKVGSEAQRGCFVQIATESGILSFLQFGKNITESKNNPIKLLKLLDIFKVLSNLRLDFNRLFGGKASEEIRTMTKDLIRSVVNGSCEIFWELPAQVKLQRSSSPPTDGSVPRLVSFVTDYCNQLLGDTYSPHLTKVLEIHMSWRNEKYQEGIIFTHVYDIIKEIAVNLDAWSKAYEDITLSYLFMMNNHCHFYNLKDTMLGKMMGDSWLTAHEQYQDYYAALYVRNSWGRIQGILIQKDLLSSSGGRVTKEDLVGRLNAFNLAFDERYKKQCNWIISDEMLREKVCKHLVEGIVPTYRAYLKNYSLSNENDAKAAKHIEYTELNLENMLRSLFQPKLRTYGSIKQAHLITKIKRVSNQLRLALTAM